MKVNQLITHQERVLTDQDTLISTTDLKGVLTSANESFVDVSGFSIQELVGKAHNIVRHPEMPAAAFQDLWSSLKRHQPWMGLVKNRCKNGDHYYVDAFVAPIFENGSVSGYQSVRFRAEPEVIARAENFYQTLQSNQSTFWQALKPSNISYRFKCWWLALGVCLPLIIAAIYCASEVLAAASLATFLLTGWLASWMLTPLLVLSTESKALFDNPIARYVYSGRRDEVGQLAVVIKMLRAQNRTILSRVEQSASELGTVALETDAIVGVSAQSVARQHAEVEQVATAMHEMSATVTEVARNAEITADYSTAMLQKISVGEQLVSHSIKDLSALSQTVAEAVLVIEKLRQDSELIGSVVDVISNIASETNLLALNAAIEAARAGEQGRGFAVVADEVRNLASNTQQSTDEIKQMIESIQQTSSAAVVAMSEGKKYADESFQQARRVGVAFAEISADIGEISDLNTQVATATEQQSEVAEEINRNVLTINDLAGETLSNAHQTSVASTKLRQLVTSMEATVKQFGEW